MYEYSHYISLKNQILQNMSYHWIGILKLAGYVIKNMLLDLLQKIKNSNGFIQTKKTFYF